MTSLMERLRKHATRNRKNGFLENAQIEFEAADALEAAEAKLKQAQERMRERCAKVDFRLGIWHVRIGRVTVGHWSIPEANMSAENAAKSYAAKINAELAGGIEAFGCHAESKGKNRCISWCGFDTCPITIDAALEKKS